MSEQYEYGHYDHAVPSMAHPYREGLLVALMLCGLFALLTAATGALAVVGILTMGWVMLPAVFLVVWVLLLAVVWAWGMRKLGQMRDFLSSARPLVRWWYTPDEWAAIQAEQAEGQRAGWLLAPGCLAALLALAGLLVGSMLGIETGMGAAVMGGGIGLVSGAVAGGVLGAAVAGGNYLAHRWTQRHDQQTCVALGAAEILYGRMYFRSNGITHWIEQVTLQEHPPLLLVEVWNPKPLGQDAETWTLPVPQRMVAPLRGVLPEIRARSQHG